MKPPLLSRRTALMTLGAALIARPAAAAVAFTSKRIAVTVRGRGPDVVLIPGLASGPAIWSRAVATLPGYRFHLVHVRGFAGLAPEANRTGPVIAPLASELSRYILAASLRRPALVGHSMGGVLAMRAALDHPERVGRLMVVDMLPEGAAMIGGTAAGIGYLADQLGAYFTTTKAGRQLFADMLRQNPASRDSDPDVVAQALRELGQINLTPQLGKLRQPMTVVHAIGSDAQLRAETLRRYRSAYASVRQAKLVPIGPSGHVVMADQPARFAAELKAFLGG